MTNWMLFVSSALTDLLRMLLDAAIFFFMALYVAPGLEDRLVLTGGYATFVVLGFLVAALMDSLLKTFYETVASGYWSAQFEFYGAFPMGIPAYLAGSAVFHLFMAALRFALVLAVGMTAFGVVLDGSNAGTAALVLLVGTLPAVGLGLAAASTFYLLDSRGWNDPISWAVHVLASLLAGVYFPPEILPAGLRLAAMILPHYHLLRALRLVAVDGAGLEHPVVAGSLAVLAVMAAIFIPAGALLFRAGMRRADRLGQFTRWT
jgi:ABC-type multidrug transport system permease subunit